MTMFACVVICFPIFEKSVFVQISKVWSSHLSYPPCPTTLLISGMSGEQILNICSLAIYI